jgi:hypothetical protein
VRLLAAALILLAGCLEERPRPAPPLLAITLSTTTAQVRDTVTGTVRADDASGLDSLWLALDNGDPDGRDGQFETSVQVPFRLVIVATHHAGDVIPIELRARDLDGFVSQRDTTVRVVP